jgi:catalase
MSDWEQQHIADAFQFELGKVQRPEIRERLIANLAHVDPDLASEVAEGLGLKAPAKAGSNDGRKSPALSQAEQPRGVATRKVAVLAADGADAASLDSVLGRLRSQGALCEILGTRGGTLAGGVGVDRPLLTMASVLYDAVLVAGGSESVDALQANGAAVRFVAEAYKRAKPVGAIGEGVELLREAPLNDARLSDNGLESESGVVTLASVDGDGLAEFASAFGEAIAQHRHFDRRLEAAPA